MKLGLCGSGECGTDACVVDVTGEFLFSRRNIPAWLCLTMEDWGGLKVAGGERNVAAPLAVGVAGENISWGLRGVEGKLGRNM